MRIQIRAIGNYKNTPETALIQDYLKRLEAGRAIGINQVTIQEIKSIRARQGEDIKTLEADKLMAGVPASACVVALDERGKNITSRAFAELLNQSLQNGHSDMVFMIGGADGLADNLRQSAQHVLSLGKMTLPHLLARLVLAEQLWRGVSILTNHPYHRD
ncbi:MAG: 23S rRNA (pseudouridine(1915)-N(3))-methyltransferase RlmH [Parvibaculales bacterium]